MVKSNLLITLCVCNILGIYGVLYVPLCPDILSLSNFTLSSGNGSPTFDTNVTLCYTKNTTTNEAYSLLISYSMNDINPSSPYNGCNEPLYKADAVELFISPLYSTKYTNPVTTYIEIERNMNKNGLFVNTILNTCNDCSCITGTNINCNDNGIIKYDSYKSSNYWMANIEITFDFIIQYSNNINNGFTDIFVANFYRIDKINAETQYSCYNPTYKNPPCFHVPSSFVMFQLQ